MTMQGCGCNVKVDFFRFSGFKIPMKMKHEEKNISTHGIYTPALSKTFISSLLGGIAPTWQTSKNWENGKIPKNWSFLTFTNIWNVVTGQPIILQRMFMYEFEA